MITFHIGWPQGILIGLFLFTLCRHIIHHGEPRTGVDGFNGLINLVDLIITFAILYWGGFFR